MADAQRHRTARARVMALLRNRYTWCALGLVFGLVLERIAVVEVGGRGHGTDFLMYVVSLPAWVLGGNQVWGEIVLLALPPIQWLLVALCLHGSLVEGDPRWVQALIVLGAVIVLFVPIEWWLERESYRHPALLYRLAAGGLPGVLMITGGVLLLRRGRASVVHTTAMASSSSRTSSNSCVGAGRPSGRSEDEP